MPEKAATISNAPPETASWTRFLPEVFGIQEKVRESPFRWCARESAMWGTATGTAMGIHRLRMKSHPLFAGNIAFGTALLVSLPSYYFCCKRREHKHEMIELMMKANDFQHDEEMPEKVPDEQHPFLDQLQTESGMQKEFVANMKEKKEWQKGHTLEEPANIFKEVKK